MTNLIKRKKAERRFQLYGIFAVSSSLLFVLILVSNIFFSGIGGFFKTSFVIPFHFDQSLLKIDENFVLSPLDLKLLSFRLKLFLLPLLFLNVTINIIVKF